MTQSRSIRDFIRPQIQKDVEGYEEVPDDFEDGWTEDDIRAVGRKIVERLKREGKL